MSAEIESAIVANTAAWWDYDGEHVHDGLMDLDTAMEQGGIDWPVWLVPVEYGGEPTDYSLLVRGSDHKVLHCVGPNYQPLQNRQLGEYMKDLVDNSELQFESAMSLKGGKIVALCARTPEGITIAGEENVPYLTGANWHNGFRRAVLFFSVIRTVCRNTLDAGLESAQNVFPFKHTTNMEYRMQEARNQLQMGFEYVDEVQKIGDTLSMMRVSGPELETFLKTVVPDPSPADVAQAKKTQATDPTLAVIRTRDGIKSVYKDQPDMQNITGNRWGLLQAVTGYNNHVRNFEHPDNRFEQVVLSRNENTQRALDYLLAT